MKKNQTNLLILNCVFVVSLILSNILAAKIVTFGSFVIPAAVVAYPITFLMTDIVGEIWGKKQANLTVKIGLACQILSLGLIFLAIQLPVAGFADNQEVFQSIMGAGVRVTLASMTAYICSQSWDVAVFHSLKAKSNGKHKWLRNNVSTMTSQIIDTSIFITVAFYGVVPNLLVMILSQYVIKFTFALLDTPIFYLLTRESKVEEELEKSII